MIGSIGYDQGGFKQVFVTKRMVNETGFSLRQVLAHHRIDLEKPHRGAWDPHRLAYVFEQDTEHLLPKRTTPEQVMKESEFL